jgi:hypothetical protein
MIPGYPEQLYRELQDELQRIRNSSLPEDTELEACFGSYMRHAGMLCAWVSMFRFENEEDEICFFKEIKPRFTSGIEFYKKMYQAFLFRPAGNKEQVPFYEYEIDKIDKFLTDNAGFYQYYKNGLTTHDDNFFIRKCLEGTSPKKPCLTETTHDVLLATIQGLEKYKDFVQLELEKLRQG